MTWRRGTAAGLFLCLAILGFLLALQLRIQPENGQSLEGKSIDELTGLVAALNQETDRLSSEVSELRLAALSNRYRGESDVTRLTQQERDVRILSVVSGLRPAFGRGLRLLIRDPKAELSPVDLDQLVNELKASGAEAVMVSGRRVDTRSSLTAGDGGLFLSGERLINPYMVEAVGNPSDLESAMEMAGGIVSSLESHPGVTVEISRQRKIEVPTVSHEPIFLLARKAKP